MSSNNTIQLNTLIDILKESRAEVITEFPGQYVDYPGLIPVEANQHFRYLTTPVNTSVFAHTGGDGVHYSLLQLSETVQPVIITVPAYSGLSKDCNRIIAENLNEFLSLGYYNGWFTLEQLCYDPEAAIDLFASEDLQSKRDIPLIFEIIRKMRTKLGYQHIPLDMKRLLQLEELYFHKLDFDSKTR